MEFLTEQGKNEKDWDHYKPYVAGEKKGKVWQAPAVAKSTNDDDEFMVSTEWDDVLTNANESEIVELAGILFLNDFSSKKRSYMCLIFSYSWFYWFNQSSSISCSFNRQKSTDNCWRLEWYGNRKGKK